MKKKLIISLIVLVFFGVAATPHLPWDTLQQLVSYITERDNTFTGTNTFTGSVAIGTTGGSATLTLNGTNITASGSGSTTYTTLLASDLRAGVSPMGMHSNTVLTVNQLDGRTYYMTGTYIVQHPTVSSATGYAVNLMDSVPDGGVTLFCNGTSIWYGVGSSSGTATTIWANAGARASGWTLSAFPTIRAGTVAIKIVAPDLSWYSKP